MIVEGGIRRRDNRIWYLLLGVFAATFLFTFLNKQFTEEPEAEAASLANFDPGYIISDWQMSNYTSMTEAEIQDFLWKKGKCYNTSFSAVGTRVDYFSDSTPPTTWHVKDGHTVCLAEEDMNGETAAHIIWQTAQDYKINPQVLIVLLQKETGLITDPIPNSWDYQRATGYGCPDTAACSSKYYGFKNQIRNAAALFRTVLDGGWTNYPLGENYVQYNPNAACGGSVVNIRSLATSALYRYTPYQPNAGALAAGYGTASCGAYGNRNFYLYFQDWFGGITNEVAEAVSKHERTIEDGVYRLYSKTFGNKVVDIKGGLNANGSLQMYSRKATDADNQLFEIKYDEEDGFYNITNPKTGSAFDVKGASTAESTPVNLHSLHSNCNQDWLFEKEEDNYYKIISRCSGKALDLSLSRNALGIFSEHGGNNQKWQLVKVDLDHNVEDGVYRLYSKTSTEKVVDIKGGLVPNGMLQLYPEKNTGVDNQLFEIRYDKTDGFYNIINPATGSAFDVKGASTADSTPVKMFQLHSNCNQDWLFEKGEDNYYKIISRCSGKVLDYSVSRNTPGIFTDHGGDNQKWLLVKNKEEE